jgi:multidrug efflux system membrane fusion protein
VNAQLLETTLENVVTIPTAAIQRGAPGSTSSGANGSYVYIVNADDTVSVRQIVIGPTDGTMTAVNSGLTNGEHVVVDGADRLRDGLHVNVATIDGKPNPAAGASGVRGPGGSGARSGSAGGSGSEGSGSRRAKRNGEPSQPVNGSPSPPPDSSR